jgi:hypothetical protein
MRCLILLRLYVRIQRYCRMSISRTSGINSGTWIVVTASRPGKPAFPGYATNRRVHRPLADFFQDHYNFAIRMHATMNVGPYAYLDKLGHEGGAYTTWPLPPIAAALSAR